MSQYIESARKGLDRATLALKLAASSRLKPIGYDHHLSHNGKVHDVTDYVSGPYNISIDQDVHGVPKINRTRSGELVVRPRRGKPIKEITVFTGEGAEQIQVLVTRPVHKANIGGGLRYSLAGADEVDASGKNTLVDVQGPVSRVLATVRANVNVAGDIRIADALWPFTTGKDDVSRIIATGTIKLGVVNTGGYIEANRVETKDKKGTGEVIESSKAELAGEPAS